MGEKEDAGSGQISDEATLEGDASEVESAGPSPSGAREDGATFDDDPTAEDGSDTHGVQVDGQEPEDIPRSRTNPARLLQAVVHHSHVFRL